MAPVHEIWIFFWPKAFFWSIMKIRVAVSLHFIHLLTTSIYWVLKVHRFHFIFNVYICSVPNYRFSIKPWYFSKDHHHCKVIASLRSYGPSLAFSKVMRVRSDTFCYPFIQMNVVESSRTKKNGPLKIKLLPTLTRLQIAMQSIWGYL